MQLLSSKNFLVVIGLAAIVGMALWSPIKQFSIYGTNDPIPVREITRLNKKLPDGTLKIPPGGIILPNELTVSDPVLIGRHGDVVIREQRDLQGAYQIVWIEEINAIRISIQGGEFDVLRPIAESVFLSDLAGNSVSAACSLNASISTAPWINPLVSPEPLSYCS